jgi:hypothetical protein
MLRDTALSNSVCINLADQVGSPPLEENEKSPHPRKTKNLNGFANPGRVALDFYNLSRYSGIIRKVKWLELAWTPIPSIGGQLKATIFRAR